MPEKSRNQLKKLKYSKSIWGKAIFSISLFLWSVYKFFTNPRYRSEQVSRIRYSNKIIQVSTYTKENRYPVLFKQIAEELKDIENPKILSFGCSTGEEVLSLKQIIPNAGITGVDINYWCIKTARRNNPYSDCQFIFSHSIDWKKRQFYDCILALAVLQKSKNREPHRMETTCSFGFEDFENVVVQLSHRLKRGGIFVLDHSDYRLTDVSIFDLLFTTGNDYPISRSRISFDTSNNISFEPTSTPRIYKKR